MCTQSRMRTIVACYSTSVREVMRMELLERMNGALAYIEENLTEDIDYKEIARLAACSEYHFTRNVLVFGGHHLVGVHPPQKAHACSF